MPQEELLSVEAKLGSISFTKETANVGISLDRDEVNDLNALDEMLTGKQIEVQFTIPDDPVGLLFHDSEDQPSFRAWTSTDGFTVRAGKISGISLKFALEDLEEAGDDLRAFRNCKVELMILASQEAAEQEETNDEEEEDGNAGSGAGSMAAQIHDDPENATVSELLITGAVAGKLVDAGINTVPELEQAMEENVDPWNKDITGIGPAMASSIERAVDQFRRFNPKDGERPLRKCMAYGGESDEHCGHEHRQDRCPQCNSDLFELVVVDEEELAEVA